MTPNAVDRYQIRGTLGRGAMGSVYLAFDPKMNREVAVKVLDKRFVSDAKARMRFDREARAIAALRHPNIVNLYDYSGEASEQFYLVMELIEGPDVGNLCRATGTFPESVLVGVGRELATALDHAHRAGIIHRDIKPENVFVDQGRVVLADFGIAKILQPETRQAAPTDVVGTPGFMSPEQVEQRPIDARADLFAVGALLYYLGTQKLPYVGTSLWMLAKQFREATPPLLHEVSPWISPRTSAVVHQCLEIDPERRPASADALRQQLGDILVELGATDVRDALARYQRDPAAYREEERTRLALRPPPAPADVPPAARPAAAPPARRWRRLTFAAAAIGATSLAAALTYRMWIAGAPAPAAPAAAPVASHAHLRIDTRERARLFVNGRDLGEIEGPSEHELAPGRVTVELVHAKRGRVRGTFELADGDALALSPDWPRRRLLQR